MIKNIFYTTLVLLVCTAVKAQDVYTVNKSYVHFFSEAPLENIEAKNSSARALVNIATNKFAFIIPIKSFEFDKELMKEHFNENYMESEKYSGGSFKGDIDTKIDWKKPGTYEVEATGVLNIHGVDQKRTISGKVEVTSKGIVIKSKFKVKLEDHEIEIPTIVFQNIAEVIDVTVEFSFIPKK